MTDPAWLTSLLTDHDLIARHELTPLDPASAAGVREACRDAWAGKHDDDVVEQGMTRIARSTPVGLALPRARRVSGEQQRVIVWLDPGEDQLFAGFTEAFPPQLWLPLGQSASSLEQALSPYRVERPSPVATLPEVERFLKGVSPDKRESVEAVCDRWDTWLDDARWANGHADDPWAAWPASTDALERPTRLREASAEKPGRTPSTSYRTLWSKSVLTIEYHPFHCVFVARYQPATVAPAEAIAALAGETVAPGVPLDLVASLLRAGNATSAWLDAQAGEWELAHDIARCALEPGEPSAGEQLRARFELTEEDYDARLMLVRLASHYQHHGVLRDIALCHPWVVDDSMMADIFAAVMPPSGAGGAS